MYRTSHPKPIVAVASRGAFTIVELLVSITIILVLVGLLLPSIQNARESARVAQCQSNLHQISLATELFHETYKAYPPARFQPRPDSPVELQCGGEEATWLVRIMPFLEQVARAKQWDLGQSYASHADAVRNGNLAVYCCPSRRTLKQAVGQGIGATPPIDWTRLPCGCDVPIRFPSAAVLTGAVGDYGGNHGDLSPGSFGLPTDFYYGGNGTGIIISSHADCRTGRPGDWVDRISHTSVTDGLSNTILTGEMHVPLNKLREATFDAFIFSGDVVFNSTRVGGPGVPIVSDPRDQLNGLVSWGSWHLGGCQFAFADGSIHLLSNTIDTETLSYLCNRYDNQVSRETIP